jgi:ATP-binding cassette subfamily B protein
MEKIMSMPLGFFDQHSSGKIRKIVNDGAGTTHTFLAHQLRIWPAVSFPPFFFSP